MNRRLKRIVLSGLLTTAVSGLLASSASASFHLNVIREITGDTAGGNQSYIELQMYASGENFVAGHDIAVFDDDAFQAGSSDNSIFHHTLAGPNPASGANQSTILIGDTGVTGRDFTFPELSDFLENTMDSLTQAGAICYEGIPVDCVSWGGSNFTGTSRLPDQTTPNGSTMPTGLLALRRNIGGGTCATALDAADDTNNAASDFSLVDANPRPNSLAPTETLCPPGNPASPINPAGNVRKRKCKKKQKRSAEVAKKKKKKKKKKAG